MRSFLYWELSSDHMIIHYRLLNELMRELRESISLENGLRFLRRLFPGGYLRISLRSSQYLYATLLGILSGKFPWSLPLFFRMVIRELEDNLNDEYSNLEDLLISAVERILGSELSEEDRELLGEDPFDFVLGNSFLLAIPEIKRVLEARESLHGAMYALNNFRKFFQEKSLDIVYRFYELTKHKEGVLRIGIILSYITCNELYEKYSEALFVGVDVLKKSEDYTPCQICKEYFSFDKTDPHLAIDKALENMDLHIIFKYMHTVTPNPLVVVIGSTSENTT